MKVTIDAEGAYCEHGTALDVHCCHCHSGFIFDWDHVCPERIAMYDVKCRELAEAFFADWEQDHTDQVLAPQIRENRLAALSQAIQDAAEGTLQDFDANPRTLPLSGD